MTAEGCQVSFSGDENVLELDSGDAFKTMNILTTKQYTLKRLHVNYISAKGRASLP